MTNDAKINVFVDLLVISLGNGEQDLKVFSPIQSHNAGIQIKTDGRVKV